MISILKAKKTGIDVGIGKDNFFALSLQWKKVSQSSILSNC
jgi:hypothetical protein